MGNQFNYAKEKLTVAIQSLATDPEDVRKRLGKTYIAFLHSLRDEDFPIELQEDWKWIVAELNKYEPTYNAKGDVTSGSVENTMKMIRNSTGEKIAERIFSVYRRINNEF